MDKFGKSQPVKRVEDVRFLTGAGRYIDDIAPQGALHAVLFRSPVAHAVITALDLDEARAAPGVHAVLTGAGPARGWARHRHVRRAGQEQRRHAAVPRPSARCWPKDRVRLSESRWRWSWPRRWTRPGTRPS